jgi:hypothetical protein
MALLRIKNLCTAAETSPASLWAQATAVGHRPPIGTRQLHRRTGREPMRTPGRRHTSRYTEATFSATMPAGRCGSIPIHAFSLFVVLEKISAAYVLPMPAVIHRREYTHTRAPARSQWRHMICAFAGGVLGIRRRARGHGGATGLASQHSERASGAGAPAAAENRGPAPPGPAAVLAQRHPHDAVQRPARPDVRLVGDSQPGG